MKTIGTLLILATLLGSSNSQAETFCDRPYSLVCGIQDSIKEILREQGCYYEDGSVNPSFCPKSDKNICDFPLKDLRKLRIDLDINRPGSRTELRAGDLAGLSGLTDLEFFTAFQRQEIAPGLFDDLSSLKNLVFYSEALRPDGVITIQPGSLKGLSALSGLVLEGDGFTNFPDLSSLPPSADGLNLVLNLTNLTQLPDDTIGANVLSRFTFLGKKEMQSIGSRFFRNQSRLKRIVIKSVNVDALKDDSLNGLASLEYLEMQGTDHVSTAVLPNLFRGLTGLRELTLENNFVRNVPPGWLRDLSSLTVLNFDRNHVQTLPADFLSGADSVNEVDLTSNDLSTLPPELEERLRYIQYVRLGDNPLPGTELEFKTINCTDASNSNSLTIDRKSLLSSGSGPAFGISGFHVTGTIQTTSDPISGQINYYSIDLAPWNQLGSVHVVIQESTNGTVGKIRKTSSIGCSPSDQFRCKQRDDIALTCVEM